MDLNRSVLTVAPLLFYLREYTLDKVRFMVYEKSCGAVVFTRIDHEIKYLLIRNLTGIYGFPKGHAEPGETEEQTALREVFEEVGLVVQLVPGFRSEDEHPIPQKENTIKQIVYFLGHYSNQEYTYQKEELTGACLVDYETALTLFQFDSSKRILTEANNFFVKKSFFIACIMHLGHCCAVHTNQRLYI